MLTNRVKGVEYAIREIAAVAQEVAKSGKTVYHLNIGDPVAYDFQTPGFISDALSEYSRKGKNYYADSLGVIELREEISKLLKGQNLNVSTDEIVACLVGSEMCIRDSHLCLNGTRFYHFWQLLELQLRSLESHTLHPVSYTHLTLPTILLV